jgi:eukaryotic-like serine/threonine-protein kinase
LKRDTESAKAPAATSTETAKDIRRFWKVGAPIGAVVVVLAASSYYYLHQSPKLTDKDTIVLADFSNTTGDSVFDGALRQGLSVQLGQSPFLKLVSEEEIQQTLRLMGQSAEAHLAPSVAREVCQRTQSTALIESSISSLGTQYVLGLKAVNCGTGESLAEEQVVARTKEQVLTALGDAATKLRRKMGESLSSIQKFDTPLEQATTPSLEALQAYSMGIKALAGKGDDATAIPFFQRALQLDPNFASASAWLGSAYNDLGESSLGAENLRKAYELRQRVSERERMDIETYYQIGVTGDLQKAKQSAELKAQIYPRDWDMQVDLGIVYGTLGQYDKALAAYREALRIDPASSVIYSDLVQTFINVNRLEDARRTADEAKAKKLDSPDLRLILYGLAFLQNDGEGMAREVAWSQGKPGVEADVLFCEAETAAYVGRLKKSREFSRAAISSAQRAGQEETAAGYEAGAALRESLFGNAPEAAHHSSTALSLQNGRDAQYGAALALAFAGEAGKAAPLTDELAKRYPENTLVRFNYVPTLQAQIALVHKNPSIAIESLEATGSYDLGSYEQTAFSPALYSVYVRGLAYLAMHDGDKAAVEFQKILDHRGVVLYEPIGALAHLQIGRAYAMQGDTAKAKAAYQDFLTLWKDADPDIPILKEAKAEYAKLQ